MFVSSNSPGSSFKSYLSAQQKIMSLLTLSILALASPLLAADTSGCGKTHDSDGANGKFYGPGDAHSITVNGERREYGIWVPPNYNSNTQKQRRLIFDYHGNGGCSDCQHKNTKYQDFDNSYIVVYPQGLPGSGTIACFQSGEPYCDGHDDLTFTTELLKHIRQEYCIDSDHVYASGKSNGGGFVNFLACSDNGDEFAAFAMASAALYTDMSKDSCSKKRAIMEAHGDNDCTICYYGEGKCPSQCQSNNGKKTPNLDNWVGWWGERDGCAASDRSYTDENGYQLQTYTCGGQEDVVQHFKVAGLGHCWPADNDQTQDYIDLTCGSYALSYTPKVLDFFGKWSLSSSPKVRKGLEWSA